MKSSTKNRSNLKSSDIKLRKLLTQDLARYKAAKQTGIQGNIQQAIQL